MEGSGVARYAITPIGEVDDGSRLIYDNWIAAGRHGAMAYLERYGDVRSNPALLLDGAQSMICCAIPYFQPSDRCPEPRLSISRYAVGADYHDVVRRRLEAVATRIRETYGGETRVCIDTAPLRERYWAARSGLGFIGLNNHLIIPGLGSYFFLGEILTTARLVSENSENSESSENSENSSRSSCSSCLRCLRACPTGALKADGSCDARRCLSYLTIEHRGDFPPGTNLHGSFYGCDRCAAVCPHNGAPLPTDIEDFLPRPALLDLTAADIAAMTQEQFSITVRGSAMKRAKLAGLQRNAATLLSSPSDLSPKE